MTKSTLIEIDEKIKKAYDERNAYALKELLNDTPYSLGTLTDLQENIVTYITFITKNIEEPIPNLLQMLERGLKDDTIQDKEGAVNLIIEHAPKLKLKNLAINLLKTAHHHTEIKTIIIGTLILAQKEILRSSKKHQIKKIARPFFSKKLPTPYTIDKNYG